ncbi:MAG TPA: hypothetical protein VHK69_20380 [Chitinophagaceae bacterium]|jgi:hypothetical protein|nr:hypothetical protein [Chitinophagaceae bacterium]
MAGILPGAGLFALSRYDLLLVIQQPFGWIMLLTAAGPTGTSYPNNRLMPRIIRTAFPVD